MHTNGRQLPHTSGRTLRNAHVITLRMNQLMAMKWTVITVLITLVLVLSAGCTGQQTAGVDQPTDGNGQQVQDGDYASPINTSSIRQQVDAYPAGTLTEEEEADILFIREEEKLARDVYAVLYEQWSLPVFANIGDAEQTHMDSVGVLIERYGLEDPVQEEAGVFTNPDIQALYDTFVTEGEVSEAAALGVGAQIEEIDLVDIMEASNRTDQPDIQLVYDNLMRGSRNHLRAYVRNLEVRGDTYEPIVLSQEEYEAIVGTPAERGPS
jgi:hypothetical protein